jgi:predicted nucleic acid-binding protein
LVPHCVVHSSPVLYRQALLLHRQIQYRYYDSLVVASAIHAGASRLYSENLQHGRTIAGLEIINPFVDD